MTWIQPLELQTIFLNVFSGSPEIFFGIALLCIVGMAAYFRMTTLTMFFMVGIFVVMFNALDVIPAGFNTFIIVLAALAIGLSINKLFNRQ